MLNCFARSSSRCSASTSSIFLNSNSGSASARNVLSALGRDALRSFMPAAAQPSVDAASCAGSRGFAAAAVGRGPAATGEGASTGVAEGEDSGESTESKQNQKQAGPSSVEGEEGGEDDDEHLASQLLAQEAATKQLTKQVEQLTHALKSSLADMENLRMRTSRDVDNAKKFAIQGFVKDLFDVSDNLERAATVVPPGTLAKEESAASPEQLRAMLRGLVEGVNATEQIMTQVFKKNNVVQYNPVDEQFDPNFHMALFKVPDASKTPGTIAVVTKRGYSLAGRVIRPAEVGVVG
ncbi:MAG: hypothetical protein WDW36_008689 [Sanguina aurantia]